jgi:cell division protein FtsZ
MTLFEVDEAAPRIREEVAPHADITVGAIFDPELEGKIRGIRRRHGRLAESTDDRTQAEIR